MATMTKNLFNEDIKEEFLSQYDAEGTKDDYRRILSKCYETEVLLNKDLYDFNIVEISNVLHEMKAKNFRAIEKNGRIISAYLTWAFKQRLRKDKNPLSEYSADWFQNFVNKENKIYFTDKQIKRFESGCVNPQDAVIIRLLFLGVNGNDEYDELRNLTMDDIEKIDDEHYVLHLNNDDGTTRDLIIGADDYEVIEEAFGQHLYRKRNGKMTFTSKHAGALEFTELVRNRYILRNSETGTTAYDTCVSAQLIYRRLKTISDTIQVDNLTGKNIRNSGMIYLAKKLYKEHGGLERSEYQEIAKVFNLGERWHHIKKFVNIDMIHELYD